MQKQIREALALLDPSDDSHWTGQGLPAMDVVRELVGEPVTRGQVKEAAPEFSRENRSLEAPAPAKAVAGTDAVTEAAPAAPAAPAEPVDIEARRRELDAQVAELDQEIHELRRRRSAVKAERDELVVEAEKNQPSREEIFKRKCEDDFRRQYEAALRKQEAHNQMLEQGQVSYEHPIDRAMRSRKVEYPIRDQARG